MQTYINTAPLRTGEDVSLDRTHDQNPTRASAASFEAYIFSLGGVVYVVRIRHCAYCGGFIFSRHGGRKYCSPLCTMRGWNNNSEKRKEWILRNPNYYGDYYKEWVLKNPEKIKVYHQRPEVKAKMKVYRRRPEAKAKRREYKKKPLPKYKDGIRGWTWRQVQKGNLKLDYCRNCWEEKGEIVTENLGPHHYKYIRSLSPDVVTVLCGEHHQKLHNKLRVKI